MTDKWFQYIESERPVYLSDSGREDDPFKIENGVEISFRNYHIRRSCFQCAGCHGTDGVGCIKQPWVELDRWPTTFQVRPMRPGGRLYMIYLQWGNGLPETDWTEDGTKKSLRFYRGAEEALQVLKKHYAPVPSKEEAERLANEALAKLLGATSPAPRSSQP